MNLITSRDNPLVKDLRRLSQDSTAYRKLGLQEQPGRLEIVPFIDDMAARLTDCDLLICRAEWAEQVLQLVREMPTAA